MWGGGGRGKGLAGARVDDGLLGQQGEVDRGKEGLDSGTFRSRTNSRTAKPVLRQVLLTGGKEEEWRYTFFSAKIASTFLVRASADHRPLRSC